MKKNLNLIIALMFCVTLLFSNQADAKSKSKYQLSTHILDINSGLPASNVSIQLHKYHEKDKEWKHVADGKTDKNGRISNFLKGKGNKGIYKLTFMTKPYFEMKQQDSFYPHIDVIFEIKDDNHYHVPITLSPFGYSTYRGS